MQGIHDESGTYWTWFATIIQYKNINVKYDGYLQLHMQRTELHNVGVMFCVCVDWISSKWVNIVSLTKHNLKLKNPMGGFVWK